MPINILKLLERMWKADQRLDYQVQSSIRVSAMGHDATVQFVIAHYKEDLSWLAPIVNSSVIYTKGIATSQYPERTLALPNIGREGHTYLHHIVTAYDSLPEVTVFLQGRIDDHTSLQPAEIREMASHTRPGEVTTFPWRELELFDCWNGIPWGEYPCWEKWSSMTCKQAPLTAGQYFQALLGHDQLPDSVGFQPGAIFAVHRNTIRRHPRAYYEKLLQTMFLGGMAHVNPETGHYMERFWLAMWRPEEYICWDATKDTACEERNKRGQLAKGRWHRTPKGVRSDVYIESPRSAMSPSSGLSSGQSSPSESMFDV